MHDATDASCQKMNPLSAINLTVELHFADIPLYFYIAVFVLVAC